MHYEIPYGAKELPILVSVGAGLCFAWKELFSPAIIVAPFGGHWGNFIARFIMLIFVMCIWPAVIMKTCNSKSTSKATTA